MKKIPIYMTPCSQKKGVFSMCIAVLFFTSVAIIQLSKLRLGKTSIGLGEFMLAIWIICTGLNVLFSRNLFKFNVTKTIVIFWIATFAVLGVGRIVSIQQHHAPDQLIHNTTSLIFSAALCTTVAFRATNPFWLEKMMVRAVVIFSLIQLVLYIYTFWFPDILGMNLFYNMRRYRYLGLSSNPNQLALYCIIALPICASWFMFGSLKGRVVALVAAGISITIGLNTRSDALLVAWGMGLLLLLLSSYFILARKMSKTLWGKIAGICMTGFIVCTLLFYYLKIKSLFIGFYDKAYIKGDAGIERIEILQNGFRAFLASPIVGLGPGSFSGMEAPFQNTESHNTLLDWSNHTGVLGACLLIALFSYSLFCAFKTKRFELVLGMITLIIFSQFHYVLRHPIVWIFLILLLSANSIIVAKNPVKQIKPCMLRSKQ